MHQRDSQQSGEIVLNLRGGPAGDLSSAQVDQLHRYRGADGSGSVERCLHRGCRGFALARAARHAEAAPAANAAVAHAAFINSLRFFGGMVAS